MNRVFGHGAVHGPFAAHDTDQPAGRIDLNHVVARKLLGTLAFFSRADQRPRAGKSANHVVRRHLPCQIVIQVPQHVLDVRLVTTNSASGSTSSSVVPTKPAVPRHGKQNAPVFGFGNQ
jgi:hypothetical protein